MDGVYTMLGLEGYGSYRYEDGAFSRVHESPRGVLTPGLIDLHIHGAFGVDWMSADARDMVYLAERLAAEGYEAFLPTTITGPADAIRSALKQLPDHPMMPGFHLEGPFLSPEFPGAQPPEHIADIPYGDSEWDDILDDPRLRIVTLAPERPHALEMILRLQTRGVIVSIGHTNATYEEARRGFEFGATHTTHTFNAMRGLHHREAGTVGYALHQPGLRCELIYDRLHVVRDAAALLLKIKPLDGVIAVSDSTAATGLPKGTALTMWGHPVDVGKREVRLKSNGALAGSAITLADAFRNLAEDFGPECAIRACCHNPRLALRSHINARRYVLWDDQWQVVELFDASAL